MTNSSSLSPAPWLASARAFRIGQHPVGGGAPMVLLAGPCVIQTREHTLELAARIAEVADRVGVPLVFKASYDKANRSSGSSFRGVGIERGLAIMAEVKQRLGLPLLTDVHTEEQAPLAAEVIDLLQLPAFLCRQTDFVQAIGRAAVARGRAVNVKKGQFLAPEDVAQVAKKLAEVGCHDVLLTERGVSFGYHQLVTDFRALAIMANTTGLPVCFDATHSVQEPGGKGTASGGRREFVPLLARAACAVGIHALFLEVHEDPDRAPSDGPNMVPLAQLEGVLRACKAMDAAVRAAG